MYEKIAKFSFFYQTFGTGCSREKKKKGTVRNVEIVLTIQLKQYRENQAEKCALEQIKQGLLDLKLFILKQ